MFHNVNCLFIFFCNFILNVKSIPCRGTASYKLQFQGEWTNSSSKPRPVGAKFSGLIGCSHNKCYGMWRPGEKASRGVKNVAERGDYNVLYSDIQMHIDKWKTVLERLQTKNNTIGPEAQVILPENDHPESGFTVDTYRPLVSIIAKIVPSPDWFVGIHDVNLCNKTGNWLPERVFHLFPYDAGTAQHVDNNSVVEHRSISELKGESIYDLVRGMGFIRLKLLRKFETEALVVIDQHNCPNTASFRNASPQVLFVLIVTMIFYLFK